MDRETRATIEAAKKRREAEAAERDREAREHYFAKRRLEVGDEQANDEARRLNPATGKLESAPDTRPAKPRPVSYPTNRAGREADRRG